MKKILLAVALATTVVACNAPESKTSNTVITDYNASDNATEIRETETVNEE